MSSFQCILCKVVFTSDIERQKHFTGKRHQKAEKSQMFKSVIKQDTKLTGLPHMTSVIAGSSSLPFTSSSDTSVKCNVKDNSILDGSSGTTDVNSNNLFLPIPSKIIESPKLLKDGNGFEDSNDVPQWTYTDSKISTTNIQTSTSSETSTSSNLLINNENLQSTSLIKSDSAFFCSVCEINCSGMDNFIQHLKGSKHSKKKNIQSSSSDNFFCNICLIGCTGSAPFQQHLMSYKHLKKAGFDPLFCQISNGTYTCDLCSFSCNNEDSFRLHLQSETHEKAKNPTDKVVPKTSAVSSDSIDNNSPSLSKTEIDGKADKPSLVHCTSFNSHNSDGDFSLIDLDIKPYDLARMYESNEQKLEDSGIIIIKPDEDFEV